MMAGNRKSELKALFGGGLSPADVARAAQAHKPAQQLSPQPGTEGPAPERKSAVEDGSAGPASPGEGTPHTRSASSAVKAMGLSLNAITREAEEARVLRQALLEGERVVGIDPAQIEASFVEDRLAIDGPTDEDFEALVESVREAGQQVPVLLRPHPEKQGFYQTAYGHRRIRAAARLGRPVKAVIRALTDDELVLAQGKENAERRNLSFIERALFARNLTERGFDRKTIGDALAVQKSELSRLLQVVESVPDRFIRHIGPAPKVGRERWMKLGEILSKEARQVQSIDVIHSAKFKAADSDRRFQILFSHLDAIGKPMKIRRGAGEDDARPLADAQGRVFARLKVEGGTTRIEFAEHTPSAFIDAAAELLARAHETFQRDDTSHRESES
ncbi:plasmid partitioning protein RepB [Rhizobium sp. NFR03]|uniref:plasmid partitioning protein RepB n=1 Tax=Rhizobium sp. NFR03 TaxID=1566263 RepID=UPI000B88B529|nr:plasmid partitioning protein RepB [Rhizobium sp. NFR03]